MEEELKGLLSEAVEEADSHPAIVKEDMFFTRNSYTFREVIKDDQSDKKFIELQVIIKGDKKEADSRSLDFTMLFELPVIKAPQQGTDSGGVNSGENGNVNLYQLYPTTVNAPECGTDLKDKVCIGDGNTKLGNLNNTTIYFPNGNVSWNDNNKNLNGSKVYSKGNVTMKNINGLQNVSFFIDGQVTTQNMNGQGLRNSQVIVNGGMESDHVKLSNSSIIIRGAYKINKDLTLKSNSKVCVAGSIHVVGKFEKDSSSKVYVWDSVTGIPESEYIKVSGVDEMMKYCTENDGENTPPLVEGEWQNPTVNVEYIH